MNGLVNQQGAHGCLRELALFAGAGGGILGGHLLGWRTVCAVEYEPYPGCVLVARQNDGTLPPFPIWDDVRTFDGRPWRGRVDVVSGGFPCQDISCAGKGAGLEGARSGLWVEMARIIREVRPRFVFVENSPMLTSRGLGVVLGDMAAMGFDAEWGVLGADDVGAPHRRKRIWIAGHATDADEARLNRPRASTGLRNRQSSHVIAGMGCDERQARDAHVADADGSRLEVGVIEPADDGSQLEAAERGGASLGGWWVTEPDIRRVAHGVAARVDRLCALGNGQVPAVAALAWRVLSERGGWS